MAVAVLACTDLCRDTPVGNAREASAPFVLGPSVLLDLGPSVRLVPELSVLAEAVPVNVLEWVGLALAGYG